MPKKRRRLDVVCQNASCKYNNQKGKLNIIRAGKKANGTQNYQCTECKVFFVRTKGTPLYYSKLSKKEVKNICNHFVEKNSLRGVSRVTKHSLNAVYRVANKVAQKCNQVNARYLQELDLDMVEADEMFSFVKKKKRSAIV